VTTNAWTHQRLDLVIRQTLTSGHTRGWIWCLDKHERLDTPDIKSVAQKDYAPLVDWSQCFIIQDTLSGVILMARVLYQLYQPILLTNTSLEYVTDHLRCFYRSKDQPINW
jgi:hypothetical protein